MRRSTSAILDAISEQLVRDGNVEKALQREFRIGSEDHPGLFDVLQNLSAEIADIDENLANAAETGESANTQHMQQKRDDLEAIKQGLRAVESLDDLQGLDPDMLDRSLDLETREWIDEWMDITGRLIESGMVVHTGNRLELTPMAVRRIGARILRHLHLPPVVRGRGAHHVPLRGLQGQPSEESAQWEWGLPFDLHLTQTIMNAVKRAPGSAGVALTPNDFEIHTRESGAAIATVLMIDMSRSMMASGAWDAAKRAAIALDALISSRMPQDSLELIGFSGDACRLQLADLPGLSWDEFSHGTNLQAGLRLANQVLQRYRGMNRQIIILTDGEPTAYLEHGKSVFEHPVTERTTTATLREAARIARAGIGVTTMMLATSDELQRFVHQFARIVRGRVISVPGNELGQYVVRDVVTGSVRTIR